MRKIKSQPWILLVEDSDEDFATTLRAFKKSGVAYPVKRCVDGDDALDYLFRRGKFSDPKTSPRPDLILLDLNLPGTDGREVLVEIKSDPVLKKIPAIVLTTSSEDRDIQKCYDAGANSFLNKSVDFRKFVEKIQRFKDFWFEAALLPNEDFSA
ncbi:MAG: response regulator [Nitrospinaceae bacterium]